MSLPEPAPGHRARPLDSGRPCRHRCWVAAALLAAGALSSWAALDVVHRDRTGVDVSSGPDAVCPGDSHTAGSYCPLPEPTAEGR